MHRVLLIGQDPTTVDFREAAQPVASSVNAIRRCYAEGVRQMEALGWQADVLEVRPDATAGPTVLAWLANHAPYDCIVIGSSIRVPPANLVLFEAVLNAVHLGAPQTHLGFNTRPEQTADVAVRLMEKQGNA